MLEPRKPAIVTTASRQQMKLEPARRRDEQPEDGFCQVWRQRNEFCNLLARAELSMVDRDCVIAGLLSILLIQASLARALTEPPVPAAGTWGEPAPMLSAVAQAALEGREGGDLRSVVQVLAADAKDRLAAALARLGRAFLARDA